MKKSRQKLKLLYLMKILLENTDEDHTMTVPQMIAMLEQSGISAERKSIYDDLECLSLFGIDICRGEPNGYFVGSRDFELPELKLLVDAVQSSKFITHKKSMELISKIEKLTSRHYAKQLQRQVFVANRVKTFNEKIYYNVDKIHEAISADKKITFKYFDFDVDKKKAYHRNGEPYTEPPVSLTWDDDKYYLITYREEIDKYIHYRVDKMESVELTEENRNLPDESFDLSQYKKPMFQMFHGEETEVFIQFKNKYAGAVYDRFGIDVPITKKDKEHFICRVKAAVSPPFLAWVLSFGGGAKIVSPDSVRDELCRLIESAQKQYAEDENIDK